MGSFTQLGAITCYRIVEVKNGQPLSLFHGTNKSRVLPLGEWVDADVKVVCDGSRGTRYVSGFHVFLTLEEAQDFFSKMFRRRENRRIVRCEAAGLIRPKVHARGVVYLADRIRVTSLDAL